MEDQNTMNVNTNPETDTTTETASESASAPAKAPARGKASQKATNTNKPYTNIAPNGEDGPTVEELMAELARERAQSQKFKASLDNATSEAADLKRKLRARQTADEQAQADAEEAARQHAEYVKSLERKVALMDAKNRYLSLGMSEELAADTAEADVEKDQDRIVANFRKHQEAMIKDEQAKWLASRPQIQTGADPKEKTEEQLLDEAFWSGTMKGSR